MIKVRYQGRFGNNIFQYCFGRILAEEMNLPLQAAPIEPFVGTREILSGREVTGQPIVLRGHYANLREIISNNNSPVIIDGFFQRYEHYRQYKNVIKEKWLCMDEKIKVKNHEDAVVHIRRGDYTQCGYALTADSYHKMIRSIDFKDLYIVTDGLSDSFMSNFKTYNPKIISSSQTSDFKFLMSFDKIILSQSTFSWWAAFLSDASTIVVPETTDGIWGSISRPDIDLTVDDEARYNYIKCETK